MLVQARMADGTEFVARPRGEIAETIAVRKLVDKSNPLIDDTDSGGWRAAAVAR